MPESVMVQLPSVDSAIALAGHHGANLELLMRQTGAKLVLRGQELLISGTPRQVTLCQELVKSLENFWADGSLIAEVDIRTARQAIDTDRLEDLNALRHDVITQTRHGTVIRAKTFRQGQYVQALRTHDLTFCIGPAGTGKTFLATIVAAQALLNHEFERLILTRPAVEAGERLGFLPGDLQQKINPYLRPLYDALYAVIDPEKIPMLMERGLIEVAPLAYMRGRTLDNAFVILDEAQNTTPAQMKMFLTRLGFNSRMVVTGDVTQTDLPLHQESGLVVAQKLLATVDGVAFCQFTHSDVVRHPLVQRIVTAYDEYEQQRS